MICPDEDSDSFEMCVDCEACKPDNSPRVVYFLEMINKQVQDYKTIVEGVMA